MLHISLLGTDAGQYSLQHQSEAWDGARVIRRLQRASSESLLLELEMAE